MAADTLFELHSERVASAFVVSVVGEIDMATAPELASAIDSAPDDVSRVVISLSEVTFLDSSALNALVRSQRELAHRDISFRVVCAADRVARRVFEITRLTVPLNVVDSLEEALGETPTQ